MTNDTISDNLDALRFDLGGKRYHVISLTRHFGLTISPIKAVRHSTPFCRFMLNPARLKQECKCSYKYIDH